MSLFSRFRGRIARILPLTLTAFLLAADQVTKNLVVEFIPPYRVGVSFFDDLLRIIHVYNPGIAFSLGNALPQQVRNVGYALIPLLIICLVFVTYWRNDAFSTLQRWAISAVMGGGLGNLLDRFFRPNGVVDFIDVKFFGLFGMERWPTFNVADMCVLVGAGIFMVTVLLGAKNEEKNELDTRHNQGTSVILTAFVS
jgi:signal peptidase II